MSRGAKGLHDDLVRKAAMLELTLDAMDQGISVFDADLNVVAFNRRFLELLGFPADAFKPGDSFETFIRYNAERGEYGPGDVEDQVLSRISLARTFEAHCFERTRPNGTVLEIRGTPMPGGGFLTTYTDITERRKAEQALKESEARYALAMQAVAEGVYDWNIETNEVYYSPRVKAVLGFAPEELKTVEDWTGRIHRDDFPKFKAGIRAHLKDETDRFELDYRFRAKDGTWRWARQHGFALKDEKGRAYRMAGSTGDITRQKEIEQALEVARAQLGDAIESVSAGMSLFDAEDRVVLCNSHYKEVYPGLADVIRVGATFESILRIAAERGIVADAEGRTEERIAERLALHRDPPEQPFLQRQRDGRWIQISERKTSDGGIIAVFTDVTELKRREEALAEAIREKDTVLTEFNAVLDAIDYGILFMGPDLRARLSNRAFGEMWDFQKELLARGATMRELMENVRERGLYTVPDEAFDDYARARIEAVKMGDVPPVDFHRADGKVLQYQVKSLPDGGRMLTYFDITERKRAEEALRQSEQRFKDFTSSSSDWVWEMGPDLRFTFISERALSLFGVSADDVLGKTREEVAGGRHDDEEWRQHMADLHAHRPFKNLRYPRTSDDGTIWTNTSGVPVFAPDGSFQGYRGTSSDVTSEERRERELREAKQRAEQALADLKQAQTSLVQAEKLALLGQLVAGIAHEIKNPLNFVNNFAGLSVELLGELKETLAEKLEELDEKTRAEVDDVFATLAANLNKIGEHGGRADGIVRSMLSHSREGPGERRPADINLLVEESLNLAYHGARATDQSFNVTLERDLDPEAGTVEVIPQDISRVLLNLFSNGFHATRERLRRDTDPDYRPTVRASTRRVDSAVEVRVRDNGTGIPEAVIDKIFTPFFTTKPAGEGTGLGLSLSYDIIVHQHKGTFDVDSREGEYSEFIVRLPGASHSHSEKEGAE